MRGYSYYGFVRCDILNDNRPGPDDSVIADSYALPYGRAGTYVRSLAYMYPAAKLRSGSHMSVVTHPAVVLHNGSGVS